MLIDDNYIKKQVYNKKKSVNKKLYKNVVVRKA